MSSIRAVFAAGLDAITVHGLHQWDYGRTLEVVHPDLPATMEIHFATSPNQEAIVRVAPGVNGVAVAAIPDIFLEQTRPITAWVYFLGASVGETILTVTLPIIRRARPVASAPVPAAVSDKYTEALDAINTQVESLKQGNVTVARALDAQDAEHAARADRADTATTATKATNDGNGNDIATTYQKRDRGGFLPTMYLTSMPDGSVCQFRVLIDSVYCFAVLSCEAGKTAQASLGWIKGAEEKHYVLTVADKVAKVWSLTPGAQNALERTDLTIFYRPI